MSDDIRILHLRKALIETLGKGAKHGRRVSGISNLSGVTLAYGVKPSLSPGIFHVYYAVANPISGENFNRKLGLVIAGNKVRTYLAHHKAFAAAYAFDNTTVYHQPVGVTVLSHDAWLPIWDKPNGLASYVIQQYLATLQNRKLQGFLRYGRHLVMADIDVIHTSLLYMKKREEELELMRPYAYEVVGVKADGTEIPGQGT